MPSLTQAPATTSHAATTDLAHLASADLVHFDYSGMEHYAWAEHRWTETRQWKTERPVSITASIRGTALYGADTAKQVQALQPSVRTAREAEFHPLPVASFEDAVVAASQVSLRSFGNAQPVAVVKSTAGDFYAAPLGIWRPQQLPLYVDPAPISGKWHAPAVVRGEMTVDRSAPLAPARSVRVKGGGYEGVSRTGVLTRVRAADPAVLAVVDGSGWRDLRPTPDAD